MALSSSLLGTTLFYAFLDAGMWGGALFENAYLAQLGASLGILWQAGNLVGWMAEVSYSWRTQRTDFLPEPVLSARCSLNLSLARGAEIRLMGSGEWEGYYEFTGLLGFYY